MDPVPAFSPEEVVSDSRVFQKLQSFMHTCRRALDHFGFLLATSGPARPGGCTRVEALEAFVQRLSGQGWLWGKEAVEGLCGFPSSALSWD